MLDPLMGIIGEGGGNMFENDDVAVDEFMRKLGSRVKFPEELLMLAVLQDAVAVFQKNACGRGKDAEAKFTEVERWISEKGDWLFSFNNICETLGINPPYLRKGLIEWKARQKPGIKNIRKNHRYNPYGRRMMR